MELNIDDNLSWQIYADWLEDRGDPQADLYRRRYVVNSIGMEMALIPTGKFLMGSPPSEKGRFDDEGPQHEVEITEPFYLAVYQVTQSQWRRVMGNNPSWFSSTGQGHEAVQGLDTSDFPVECVSWEDAVKFCEKLSELPEEKQAGRVYRLPTEAEWEYACRAGTTTPFHFGESLSSEQANFNGGYPYGGAPKGPFLGRTTNVGSYPPNVFGLYDMHGNVWEWCQDAYKPYVKESKKRPDPTISSGAVVGTSTPGAAGPPIAAGSSRTSDPRTTGSVSPLEGKKGSDPTVSSSRAVAGATMAGTAVPPTVTCTSRTTGSTATDSVSSVEGEHSPDPIACSAAVAGSTTAGAAGPPSAGACRSYGTGASGSVSPLEGKEGSDPTLVSSEVVSTITTEDLVGQPSVTEMSRGAGTGTAGSDSPVEDEHSSDPTSTSSAAVAGISLVGTAGQQLVTITSQIRSSGDSDSESPVEDDSGSDPTISSEAADGLITAGDAVPLIDTGSGQTTGAGSSGSVLPATEGERSSGILIVRGGCWRLVSRRCRSANRSRAIPSYASQFIGFRLVCQGVS